MVIAYQSEMIHKSAAMLFRQNSQSMLAYQPTDLKMIVIDEVIISNNIKFKCQIWMLFE